MGICSIARLPPWRGLGPPSLGRSSGEGHGAPDPAVPAQDATGKMLLPLSARHVPSPTRHWCCRQSPRACHLGATGGQLSLYEGQCAEDGGSRDSGHLSQFVKDE